MMTRFYNPAGAFELNDGRRFDMIGDPEARYSVKDVAWLMDSEKAQFIGRRLFGNLPVPGGGIFQHDFQPTVSFHEEKNAG